MSNTINYTPTPTLAVCLLWSLFVIIDKLLLMFFLVIPCILVQIWFSCAIAPILTPNSYAHSLILRQNCCTKSCSHVIRRKKYRQYRIAPILTVSLYLYVSPASFYFLPRNRLMLCAFNISSYYPAHITLTS